MSDQMVGKCLSKLSAVTLARLFHMGFQLQNRKKQHNEVTRSTVNLNQNVNSLQIIDRVVATVVNQNSIRLSYFDEETQMKTSFLQMIGMDTKENQDYLAQIFVESNTYSILELINKLYSIIGTRKNTQYIQYFSNSLGPLSLNDAIAQVEQTVHSEEDSIDELFELMGTSTLGETIELFLSMIGNVTLLNKNFTQSLETLNKCIGDLQDVDESLATVEQNLVEYVDCLNSLIGLNTAEYVTFYSSLNDGINVPMTLYESVSKIDDILDWKDDTVTLFEEVEYLQDSSQIEVYEPLVDSILEKTFVDSFVTSPMSKIDTSADIVSLWNSVVSGNQSLLSGNNLFSLPLPESVLLENSQNLPSHTINLYYESIGMLYSISIKNVNQSYVIDPVAVSNAFQWASTSFVSYKKGSIPRTLLVNVSKQNSKLGVTFAFQDAFYVTVAQFNCLFTIPSMTNYIQSNLYMSFSTLSPVTMGQQIQVRSTLINNSKSLLLSVPVLFKLSSSLFESNQSDCYISLPDFGAIVKLMLRKTISGDSIQSVTLQQVNNVSVLSTFVQGVNDSIRFLLIESKCSDQTIEWSVRGASKNFRIVCKITITCTYPIRLKMTDDAFGLHWQNVPLNEHLYVYRKYNLIQDELESMPHQNGQFLAVQEEKAVFTSFTKTFDDLLLESNYLINANRISFENCASISTTDIIFENIELPDQSPQPMPNHVIMSTSQGPRWKQVEYPHSRYVSTIVAEQTLSNTNTTSGNDTTSGNGTTDEQLLHRVKLVNQQHFQCNVSEIFNIALPPVTRAIDSLENAVDSSQLTSQTVEQVLQYNNDQLEQVKQDVEYVVASQARPVNIELERCFDVQQDTLTIQQKLDELKRRKRLQRKGKSSQCNKDDVNTNQVNIDSNQSKQITRKKQKNTMQTKNIKVKKTFHLSGQNTNQFQSTDKTIHDSKSQMEIERNAYTDPFEDSHDEEYIIGDEEQVIEKTTEGPRWVDRPIPPYTLQMILQQGNNANLQSITDIRNLRTTNTGNISCSTLITNCIHVTNSEGKNFAGNNGHVLTQTRDGVRWMPMPIGRVKRILNVNEEQQYPACLQGFDQSVITVQANYSHNKYPSLFGRMLFIETKYYDDNFVQREMTIGTSFTIYNYSEHRLNVVLDRSPSGYAETAVISTDQTIVTIPPRVLINTIPVPQAAVFTNLSFWDVRHLVILPNG